MGRPLKRTCCTTTASICSTSTVADWRLAERSP
nr:MAG TPA: hypothetical protein [Caudoviricetes sp.]